MVTVSILKLLRVFVILEGCEGSRDALPDITFYFSGGWAFTAF